MGLFTVFQYTAPFFVPCIYSVKAMRYTRMMGKERKVYYEQQSLALPEIVKPRRRLHTPDEVEALQRALEPFVDLRKLRRIVAEGKTPYDALRVDNPPRELRGMLDAVTAMLRPLPGERIRSPGDIAGLLMVQMSDLDQEELRAVLLNTKNYVLDIHTVYKGSLNTAMIRVGEVFKEALKRNSASIIVCHNHPSGVPDPSPEDVLITKQIIDAGKLLDCDVLDHIIVGKGSWISMREKGLAFT